MSWKTRAADIARPSISDMSLHEAHKLLSEIAADPDPIVAAEKMAQTALHFIHAVANDDSWEALGNQLNDEVRFFRIAAAKGAA